MSPRNMIFCRGLVIIASIVCAANTALADAPSIVAAQSVKSHGTAGDLAVNIPLGTDGTESREGGPTELVVTFDQEVCGGPNDVWLSSGTVDSVTAVDNVVTVTLSSVSNATVLSVGFPGIQNGSGEACTDMLWTRVLAGDVYTDGNVDILDLLQVRMNLGQPVTETNCLSDVNLDSEINIYDLLTVRINLNKTAGPGGVTLIPAGEFQMGDTFNEGDSGELPVHAVYVDAFYMGRYEVTKDLWDTVNTWATANGYDLAGVGLGKAANHPVYTISWYDCVKWCNAYSQKEGRTPCYYTDAGLTTFYKTGQVAPYVKWDANGLPITDRGGMGKGRPRGGVGHAIPLVRQQRDPARPGKLQQLGRLLL